MASAVFFLDLKGKVGFASAAGTEDDMLMGIVRPFSHVTTEGTFLCQQSKSSQCY